MLISFGTFLLTTVPVSGISSALVNQTDKVPARVGLTLQWGSWTQQLILLMLPAGTRQVLLSTLEKK